MNTLEMLRKSRAQSPTPESSLPAGPSPAETPRPAPAPRHPAYCLTEAARTFEKLPEPSPCSCGSPAFWLSPYGTVACSVCCPPPPRVSRGALWVVKLGEQYEWLHRDPDLLAEATSDGTTPPDQGSAQLPTLRPDQPTLDQIESGLCIDDSPPCETCGGIEFLWMANQSRRCLRCNPPKARSSRNFTFDPKARDWWLKAPYWKSAELIEKAERDPRVAEWRAKRAKKRDDERRLIAEQAAEQAAHG